MSFDGLGFLFFLFSFWIDPLEVSIVARRDEGFLGRGPVDPGGEVIVSGNLLVGFRNGGDLVNPAVEAGGIKLVVVTEGEVKDVRGELDLLAFFEGRRVHERICLMAAALFSTWWKVGNPSSWNSA